MSVTRPVRSEQLRLYSLLMQVRPAQFADLLKKFLGVRRTLIETTAGPRFWADPASNFGQHLLRDGIYEERMTDLVIRLLRAGDVFLDVGGNEGYFSALASPIVQHGRIICVEPQSRLQPILSENIRLNSAMNISVQRVALTDTDGQTSLFLRPSTNTGASSIFRHWKLGSRSETVETMSLDSLLAQLGVVQVRLMKVDCEGAEYLVIAGARDALARQTIQAIALEYHPSICGPDRCREIHECLRSAGYVLSHLDGQQLYHLPALADRPEGLEPVTTGFGREV